MNNATERPTVGEILLRGMDRYRSRFGDLPLDHLKVVSALTACRTGALGVHEYRCNSCGDVLLLNHSCRNRHCPTCQRMHQAQWASDRMREVLPVQYFHVVFTIPHQLNDFALRNRKAVYTMLFNAAAQTLQELAADTKWLGAAIGFIAMLHTWGQTMDPHPHVHCIVPGGGVSPDGRRWINTRKDFFIPFRVLAAVFRGKFMDAFKQALDNGEIVCHGKLQCYEQPQQRKSLINALYATPWVVYAKESFCGPQAVVNYLAQYTFRIAMANSRIISADDESVRFSYKDYADNNSAKTMTLPIVEFLRRFLCHVLPQHFVRIRRFGFFANRNKSLFQKCRTLLSVKTEQDTPTPKRQVPWNERIQQLTGHDPLQCKHCLNGMLILFEVTRPVRCSNPFPVNTA